MPQLLELIMNLVMKRLSFAAIQVRLGYVVICQRCLVATWLPPLAFNIVPKRGEGSKSLAHFRLTAGKKVACNKLAVTKSVAAPPWFPSHFSNVLLVSDIQPWVRTASHRSCHFFTNTPPKDIDSFDPLILSLDYLIVCNC